MIEGGGGLVDCHTGAYTKFQSILLHAVKEGAGGHAEAAANNYQIAEEQERKEALLYDCNNFFSLLNEKNTTHVLHSRNYIEFRIFPQSRKTRQTKNVQNWAVTCINFENERNTNSVVY